MPSVSKPGAALDYGPRRERNQVHQNLEENATSGMSFADDISAVHFDPSENRNSRMTRHRAVRNDDPERQLEDLRTYPKSTHSTERSSYQYYPTFSRCWTDI